MRKHFYIFAHFFVLFLKSLAYLITLYFYSDDIQNFFLKDELSDISNPEENNCLETKNSETNNPKTNYKYFIGLGIGILCFSVFCYFYFSNTASPDLLEKISSTPNMEEPSNNIITHLNRYTDINPNFQEKINKPLTNIKPLIFDPTITPIEYQHFTEWGVKAPSLQDIPSNIKPLEPLEPFEIDLPY